MLLMSSLFRDIIILMGDVSGKKATNTRKD